MSISSPSRETHHGLPTPRSTLRDDTAGVLMWCKRCQHNSEADLQQLVDAGKGDTPLRALRQPAG